MRIQTEDFDLERILRGVKNLRDGAIVIFLGMVRKEPELAALEYEAYEDMALTKIKNLEKEAVKRFGLTKALIIHRKGRLRVGERVVMVTCSAPHRREAFEACRWLTSEMKKMVPIWKQMVYNDQDD